ncbi:MAG: SOS response-associated peptidase family protein [Sphingopyxis sp.]|uniref:SOS response-associated peptidase n=1 Tax=Sphingopyxis sp. TaxID=1908224 RepID=UPI002AB9C455|nr:SOS response-associated peptidase family protein [Sphingopyxis sp.]MDZ3830400.1 SOS response-associated peptidase family protein [Sphingopyxis sp.]
MAGYAVSTSGDTASMHLYRLDAPARAVAAALGAEAGADPWAGGHVAPGQPAPVITGNGQPGSRRHLRPKLWGVPPPPRGTQPVAHVRNLASPFWIGTLRHPELRCLVPATAFSGWTGPVGAKRQHWFYLPDRPIFAFAGIHRQGEDWPSFAILTTDPNRLVGRHATEAMPLILRAEDHDRWLTAEWRDAAQLVTPYPGQDMAVADTPQTQKDSS